MHSASPSSYAATSTYYAPPQKPSSSKPPPTPLRSSEYASIPTSAASAPSSFSRSARVAVLLGQFKERGKALIATQRPWQQALEPSTFCRPASCGDGFARLCRNFAYFRSNYALACLVVFVVCLLWHPNSLFVFLALCAAWFLLYFSRDEPVVLFKRQFDQGTVVTALSIATVMALIFTDIASSIFGAILFGMGLVALHALVRKTDDLFLDEREAASSGLVAGFGVAAGAPNQLYVRVM